MIVSEFKLVVEFQDASNRSPLSTYEMGTAISDILPEKKLASYESQAPLIAGG
jgi:hypothetical protein